ncbi:aspartic peptidase domain-containing protein [Chytriomyces sp. MP71]|nr:aspartic peptidase domain-containing protein [Chytriomyces sp. MP71]
MVSFAAVLLPVATLASAQGWLSAVKREGASSGVARREGTPAKGDASVSTGGVFHIPIQATIPESETDSTLDANDAIALFASQNPLLQAAGGSIKAAVAGTTANVDLYNQFDVAYFVEFSLGTPPQPLRVTADTGSNQLWAGSAACNQEGRCNDLNGGFDQTRSSTFGGTGQRTNITYGKGSVVGQVATETVLFSSVSLPGSPFVLVDREDSTLIKQINTTNNGIMGMALVGGLDPTTVVSKTNAQTNVKTVIHNLINGGLLAQPMFGMWLASIGADSISAQGGVLTLGGVDTTKFSGSLQYYPVTYDVANGYYWTLTVSAASIGSNQLFMSAGPVYAVIDSGTSLITVDTSTFTNQILPALQTGTNGQPTNLQYFSQYKLAVMPCENAAYLPALSVSFAGGPAVAFSVSGTQLVLKKTVQGETACVLTIQPMDVGGLTGANQNVWILGMAFMRSRYAVFDFSQNGRVGFAVPAGTSSKSGSMALNVSMFSGLLVLFFIF